MLSFFYLANIHHEGVKHELVDFASSYVDDAVGYNYYIYVEQFANDNWPMS